MILRKELPQEIKRFFEEIGVQEEELLLTTDSDLDLEGNYSTQWLVLSSTRLMNIGLKGALVWIVKEFNLNELTSVRVDRRVGNASLEVEKKGQFYEVIRFSTALIGKFEGFSTEITAVLKGRDLIPTTEQQGEKEHKQKRHLKQRLSWASPKSTRKNRLLPRIFQLLKPYHGTGVLLVFLLLTGAALDLASPQFFKVLVDNFIETVALPAWFLAFALWFKQNSNIQYLLLLVLALGLLQLMRKIIRLIHNGLITKVASQIAFNLRNRLFKKLQELSFSFYEHHQVEQLMVKITQDVEELRGLILQATHNVINILLLIGAGILLSALELHLAVYALLPALFVIGLTLVYWNYEPPSYKSYWHKKAKLNEVLSTLLSRLRISKTFGQESRETENFKYYNDHPRQSMSKRGRVSGAFHPIISCLFGLGSLIVLYCGGQNVLRSELTLGTLIAFFSYLKMFYGALSQLTNINQWFISFTSTVQRIFQILDSEPKIKKSPQAVDFEFTGAISFEELTFGYDPNFPVIKDLNLTIEPGELVGIVGPSGCGKSTMISLLCRFYDPDRGRIMIDHVDLREINPACLRQQIGLVLQEPYLFRGSITENIAFGRPDISFEEIMAAAKAAHAHDFIINLPDGYDTILGERESGLSRGEQQRIVIARALLGNPKILVLEEATSSVDPESEKAILEALEVLTKGRTTIIITHRLSTLSHADRIIVVNDGTIRETGSHQELLSLNGLYRRLLETQLPYLRNQQVTTSSTRRAN